MLRLKSISASSFGHLALVFHIFTRSCPDLIVLCNISALLGNLSNLFDFSKLMPTFGAIFEQLPNDISNKNHKKIVCG